MKRVITIILVLLVIFTIFLELKITDYVNQKRMMTGYNYSIYDFMWYDWHGYWALFGLIGCVFLIYFAKSIVNKYIKRNENYYG